MSAQSHSRSIVRFASLLLMVLAATAIAHTQDIELKITVTGPWDYVEDPDDSTRVVLVAPQADHHLPPNIDFAGGSSSLSPGRYNLDIANRKALPCKVSSPPDGKIAVLFHLPQKPTTDQIRQVIKNPSLRYAISLPKPCYYSTQESSYSIISPSVITTSAAQAEGDGYTTLMVLHYFVTVDAGGTLTSMPDKGNSSAAPLKFDTGTKTIDIKINMDQDPASNDKCDSTSADSFAKEVALFTTQKFHIWFPEYDMSAVNHGRQYGNKGHYKQGCQDPVLIAAIHFDMPAAAEIRNEIQYVENYFENPLAANKQSAHQALDEIRATINGFHSNKFRKEQLNQPTLSDANQELNAAKAQIDGKKPTTKAFDGRHLSASTAFLNAFFTAGSGDCHGAQTSVDGVL